MSSEFQLLRFPHLVLAQIINSKDLPDLFFFSLCSKRCKILVKALINRKPYQLTLRNQNIGLHIPNMPARTYHKFAVTRKEAKKSVSVEISGHKTAIKTGIRTTFAYFADLKLGIRVITDYFCDLFSLNVYCLWIGKKELWMVDWVKNRQNVPIGIGKFLMQRRRLSEDEYLTLLNYTLSRAKVLMAVPPPNFTFSGTLPKTDILCFTNATWLTIDHVMTTDVIHFSAYATKISSYDFNRFLKNWLDRGENRMRSVHLRAKNGFDVIEVLDGLMDQVTVVTEERKYQGDSFRCRLNSAYDIRRNDGVTASIWFGVEQIVFCVWPDANGKFGDSVW